MAWQARESRGRFGHVFRIERKSNRHVFALKVLVKSDLNENNVTIQLEKEVEIQKKLNHKCIIRLGGVCQDEKRYYLFMEIAEQGALYDILKGQGKFSERITGKYLRQLLNALVYLHDRRIIHRFTYDLKPQTSSMLDHMQPTTSSISETWFLLVLYLQ